METFMDNMTDGAQKTDITDKEYLAAKLDHMDTGEYQDKKYETEPLRGEDLENHLDMYIDTQRALLSELDEEYGRETADEARQLVGKPALVEFVRDLERGEQ